MGQMTNDGYKLERPAEEVEMAIDMVLNGDVNRDHKYRFIGTYKYFPTGDNIEVDDVFATTFVGTDGITRWLSFFAWDGKGWNMVGYILKYVNWPSGLPYYNVMYQESELSEMPPIPEACATCTKINESGVKHEDGTYTYDDDHPYPCNETCPAYMEQMNWITEHYPG